MKSNYRRIGDYIQATKDRNTDGKIDNLLGVNIDKFFMPSVANVVGTDLTVYKIVKKGQFACNRMHVGRDKRLPVALSRSTNAFIVSPAYDVFEVIDEDLLNREYLMMWFSRKEFDRNAWFYTDADVRGGLSWDAFCNMQLPIPSLEKQKVIVEEYQIIENRIKLNEQINQKLEETAQAIYKQGFVDFEYKGIGVAELKKYVLFNPKITIKKDNLTTYVEMNDLTTSSMGITGSIKRQYVGGSKFQNKDTLLARITPCLENGKTAFVDILEENEIAAGSTEFIVMRPREKISPYWVYCLARDEQFRSYAISSMVGSSGRQRVHEQYLNNYTLPSINYELMNSFHTMLDPLFNTVKIKSMESIKLNCMKDVLFSKLATIGIGK